MAFRKVVGQRINIDINKYVGKAGEIFYSGDGILRLSNGVTPGGSIISGLPPVQIRDTQPNAADAQAGDLWYNPETHEISIFYIDDGTSEWVNVAGGDGSGARGFTGSRGFIGFTGSRGFVGSQGVGFAGSQGDIGFTGSVGFVGSRGDIGYVGSQGAGFTGSVGFVGSRGDIGYVGSQGVIGFTGSSGFVGSTGLTGFVGSQGFTGSQGYSGSFGYTGSSGFTGSKGDRGDQGLSIVLLGNVETAAALPAANNTVNDAYVVNQEGDLYVWNGNNWFNAGQIVGPPGDIGFTGSAGFIGSFGFTGSTGFTGSAGFTGSVGFVGSRGTIGNVGFVGSQGDIGFTGSQGVGFTGSVGFVGSRGDIGYVGSQGDIGFTGSRGFVGSQGVGFAGSQGIQGIQGFTGSGGGGNSISGLTSNSIDTLTLGAGYNLIPSSNNTQDIGASAKRFQTIYLSESGINIGDAAIVFDSNDTTLKFVSSIGNLHAIKAERLLFPDGTEQNTKAPRMYTNADAANGLSLDDLLPGDFYYDDGSESIFIMVDTGLGYNSLLDLTVRAS